VTIAFNNADSGVPHDIDVFSPSGGSIGKTDVITGPAQATLSLGALAAGTYPFKCDVHPFMHGTLSVQ
jgi:plastocyanin